MTTKEQKLVKEDDDVKVTPNKQGMNFLTAYKDWIRPSFK